MDEVERAGTVPATASADGPSDRDDPHRGWVRRDVSAVPPVGAYPAKQCPVRIQNDVLRPCEPAPPSAFRRELAAAGDTWEAEVFAALGATLAPASPAEREAATLAAMAAGAPVVVAARLPVDERGRRVGEPDLLVRLGTAPLDGRWRYAPVDVKAHATTTTAGAGLPVVVQSLAALAAPDASAPTQPVGRRDATARGDCLQLAHYHRLLEAHGHALPEPAWGGVVGGEGLVAWYRLDRPSWQTPARSEGRRRRTRTPLEIYDFEFGFRLDIAAAAIAHRDDPTAPLLVEPVRSSECAACPWSVHCLPLLEARQDPSLLPRLTYAPWRALREDGITDLAGLAVAPDGAGGLSATRLEEWRLQARARRHDAVALRRTAAPVVVPRADVEVDVDMENVAEGAYLWGAWVHDRAVGGPGHYHHSATFPAELDAEAVGRVFATFWEWLLGLRDATLAAGRSFAAYCWFDGAENRQLRVGGEHTDRAAEVEDFIASEHWVDLRRVVGDQLVTGGSLSLKEVARATGFAWRDDEPGGAASMTWFRRATDPTAPAEERAAFRRRLLDYNADDVRATRHVREWLTEHVDALPVAADVTPGA